MFNGTYLGSMPSAGDMNTCKHCSEEFTKENPREVREWTCPDGCETPSQCEKRWPLKFRPCCARCYRESQRQKRKRKSGVRPRAMRRNGGITDDRAPVDRERTPMLDAAPLRKWLKVAALEERSTEQIAALCKVDESGLNRVLSGQYSTTHIDTVDRILCGLRATGMLQELYPHLYDFTDAQLAEAEEWANGV